MARNEKHDAEGAGSAFALLGGVPGSISEWPPPREAAEIASPLLFVGEGAVPSDVELVAGVRLAARTGYAGAGEHVRRMAQVDIVWLAAAEAGAVMAGGSAFADLCAAAVERGCTLICETTLAALDATVAAIPEGLRVEYLVDADSADRLVALAAARRTRALELQDVARDDTLERIERLQEEVARISRLLGDLSAQRGGLAGTPSTFGSALEVRDDGCDCAPAEMHSPVRDYAAQPPGFVPGERTTERQHAKAVRRLLRQRRMREQYFPADLFADPAWDMLLDLYAARLEHQPVSVSSLCIAAAVPATTALRWIKTMTDAGMFVRQSDPQDGRRIFIALADSASDALAGYFEALEE
jgi:DNA-binding MarR family transcriptional regulator